MDDHQASPLGKLRLIREQGFALPIMLDHDHYIAGIDDLAAEETERPFIAHLAAIPAESCGYPANLTPNVGKQHRPSATTTGTGRPELQVTVTTEILCSSAGG